MANNTKDLDKVFKKLKDESSKSVKKVEEKMSFKDPEMIKMKSVLEK